MISSDRDILISVVNVLQDHVNQEHAFQEQVLIRLGSIDHRLGRLEQRQDNLEQRQTQLEVSMRDLSEEVHVLGTRINSLELYGGWFLAAITFIITVSTLFAPILNFFANRQREQSSQKNDSETAQLSEFYRIARMVAREEIASAMKKQ